MGEAAAKDQREESAATLAITNYRLGQMERWLGQLAESVAKMAQLEERNVAHTQSIDRAFQELRSQGDRITAVELEMPTLKLVRGWVLALMVGSFTTLVGILGVLLLSR